MINVSVLRTRRRHTGSKEGHGGRGWAGKQVSGAAITVAQPAAVMRSYSSLTRSEADTIQDPAPKYLKFEISAHRIIKYVHHAVTLFLPLFDFVTPLLGSGIRCLAEKGRAIESSHQSVLLHQVRHFLR